MFGPLVVFGLGGVATEVLGDHAARLAPLTGADADDLIRSIRAAPLLLGYRGQPPADLAGLRDTLLRVSRLADDLPQVAELDLNPVIARPTASPPWTPGSGSPATAAPTRSCASCRRCGTATPDPPGRRVSAAAKAAHRRGKPPQSTHRRKGTPR